MSTLSATNLKNASSGSNNIVLNTDGSIGGTCLTQTCRAWVNFNGTGTVAIRASYNVSSITDNGTGDYTVTFTTAFANTNYTSIATVSNNTALARIYAAQPVNTATNTCRIYIGNPTGVADTTAVATDNAAIYAAFFA